MKTDLDDKIRAFEKEHKAPEPSAFQGMADSKAGRAGYELIIAIIFFAGIGVIIDLQLGTLPWVSLALFFLGFATGVYNAWRVTNASYDKIGDKIGYKKEPKDETKKEIPPKA
jgi:F0F1-type ATP synthase assembly protein I